MPSGRRLPNEWKAEDKGRIRGKGRPKGQYASGNYQKICGDDEILNPATNKCVKKTSSIGKKLLGETKEYLKQKEKYYASNPFDIKPKYQPSEDKKESKKVPRWNAKKKKFVRQTDQEHKESLIWDNIDQRIKSTKKRDVSDK